MDYKVLDNSIVICSNTMKKKILSQNILLNVKIMSMNEFLKKMTFDYNDEAIFLVMQRENVNYSLAKMYLDNIYYVDCNDYDSFKLKKLLEIKKYVYDKLIFDNLFKEYVQNKRIVVINHNLSKYEKRVFGDLNYQEIDLRCNSYDHKVYVFRYLEDEVKYVGNKICELIESGINIDKIKLYNVSSDYEKAIRRVFGFLNLNVNFKTIKPLISTIPGNYFVNHLDNIEETIEYLKNNYDLKIVNKIIGICNKYVWSNYNKDLIIEALRSNGLKGEYYDNGIEIINYLEALDDEYVFLLGFNEGAIPKSYKDEDYINDSIKMDFLENTLEKNIISKNETLKNVRSIKNLFITSKEKDNKQTFYVSSLISDIEYVKEERTKTYSKLYDKIEYTKGLDNYNKYGTIRDDLGILCNTYNIPYNEYNHLYKKINDFHLDEKLKLSYTSFQKYNECSFKYYLDNILKINPFENTFSSMIGSLVHSVLENNLKNNISVDEIIDNFIRENELSNKEVFFASKLKEDLKKIINVINVQKSMGDLEKALYEQNVVIENENYNLVGKIDKIMYKELNDKTVVCLIDYKTGSADISLKYIDYGLGMQLPIYAYLVNHSKLKNICLAGFYLQKIHLEVPKKGKKSLDEMLVDNLKLEGYSNKNKDILRLIDENYEKSSVIKSMSVKKDGNFGRYAKVLNDEEIKELVDFTKEKLKETADNINKAEFNINPKKIDKDNISCKFCKFKDICFMEDYDTIKIEKRCNDDTEEAD